MSNDELNKLPRVSREIFKDFEMYLDSEFLNTKGKLAQSVDFLKTYIFYYINANFIKSLFKYPFSKSFGPIVILANKGDKELLFNLLLDIASFIKKKYELKTSPFWTIDFNQLAEIEDDRLDKVESIDDLFTDTTIKVERSFILSDVDHPLLDKCAKSKIRLTTPEKQEVESALLKLEGIISKNAAREATKVVLGQPSYVIVNTIILSLIS